MRFELGLAALLSVGAPFAAADCVDTWAYSCSLYGITYNWCAGNLAVGGYYGGECDLTCSFCSASCDDDDTTTYTLVMADTYGDGWNGNGWTWLDSSGTTIDTGTLWDGSSDSIDLCGDCDYYIKVDSSGSWSSEVSWYLQDSSGSTLTLTDSSGNTQTTGSADDTYWYISCGDDDAVEPSVVPSPAPTTVPSISTVPTTVPSISAVPTTSAPTCAPTYTLEMYDTWGDGWNGNTWTWLDSDYNVVESGTLISGDSGTEALCGDCSHYLGVYWTGSYPYEISWAVKDSEGTTVLSGDDDELGALFTFDCEPTSEPSISPMPTPALEPSVAPTSPAPTMLPTLSLAPTVVPTSAPTCTPYFVLAMEDTYGDGWNFAELTWLDSSGGHVSTHTLSMGAFGSAELCGDCDYSISIDSGNYPTEVSWQVYDFGGTLHASGGAPGTGSDSYNLTCPPTPAPSISLMPTLSFVPTDSEAPSAAPTLSVFPTVMPSPAPTCEATHEFWMYDTFGDGWNGNKYTWYDSNGGIQAEGSLHAGSEQTEYLCGDTCGYTMVVGDDGGWPYEVSWELIEIGTNITYCSGDAGDSCEICAPSAAPTMTLAPTPVPTTPAPTMTPAPTGVLLDNDFEDGLNNWITPMSSGESDFRRKSGTTPSYGTGPTDAAGGSYYVYAESSYPNTGATFSMSKNFGNPIALVNFSYHMYGSYIGTLEIGVSMDGSNYTSLWNQTGPQGNSWFSAEVEVAEYGYEYLAFRYEAGSSYTADLGLDEIMVTLADPPTSAPTAAPTAGGTMAPTSTPTLEPTTSTVTEVSWSTTFSLTGVTAADIDDDEEAEILEGIAACSDDTDSDDLEITSITDSSRRRRKLLDDSSGVDIEYTTTLTVEDSDYSSADELYLAVASDVSTAVSSGNMTSNIQSVAASASSLLSATVDESSYTAEDYSTTTVARSDDDDGNGDDATGSVASSASAGVIAGALSGAFILGSGGAFVFWKQMNKPQRRHPGAAYATAATASMQEAIPVAQVELIEVDEKGLPVEYDL